jgi:hypothetical protein
LQVAPSHLFNGDLWSLLQSGHKAVFARSGAGKSVIVKTLYDAPPAPAVSVYVTPHKDLPRGHRLTSTSKVLHAIQAGQRRIVWKAPRELEVEGGRDQVVHDLDVLVDQLLTLGEKMMRGDKADVWCLMVIDEVQNFTSKTGYLGPVERLLAEGRKFGIRCIMVSQRPARVSLEVLGQAEHVFFLELNPPDEQYLRRAGYVIDEFTSWTAQRAAPCGVCGEAKFHFVLLQKDRWAPFHAIK